MGRCRQRAGGTAGGGDAAPPGLRDHALRARHPVLAGVWAPAGGRCVRRAAQCNCCGGSTVWPHSGSSHCRRRPPPPYLLPCPPWLPHPRQVQSSFASWRILSACLSWLAFSGGLPFCYFTSFEVAHIRMTHLLPESCSCAGWARLQGPHSGLPGCRDGLSSGVCRVMPWMAKPSRSMPGLQWYALALEVYILPHDNNFRDMSSGFYLRASNIAAMFDS